MEILKNYIMSVALITLAIRKVSQEWVVYWYTMHKEAMN